MHITLQTFLKQIANKVELKGNKLAWVVANYSDINKSDKKSFYESLLQYYPVSDKVNLNQFEILIENEEKELESFAYRDYRIKSLKLKNIRGIPSSPDGKPFGVQLSNRNKIKNAIILGANGSGKSSIYESLEYSFCQRIGEAELRTANNNIEPESEYYKDYLAHFNQSFKDSVCIVETVDGIFDIHKSKPFPENIKSKINPDSHFISDFDIYEKGHLNYSNSSDKSFHYMVAKSLGLEALLRFNTLVNEFAGYRRTTESKNLSILSNEQKKLIDNIQVWTYEIQKRKIQIKEIDENNKDLKTTIDYSQYLSALTNVKNKQFNIPYNKADFAQTIGRFYNTYTEFRNFSKHTINVNEVEFLSIGKDLLDTSVDCPFCENSKLSKKDIQENLSRRLNLIREISDIRSKVKDYYNQAISISMEYRNSIISLMNTINIENNELINIPDFQPLIKLNNQILTILKECFDDKYITELTNIDNAESSTDNSFRIFFDTILSNKTFVNNQFPLFFDEFSKYINGRNNIVIEVEKSIQTKSQLLKPFELKTILNKEISDFELQLKTAEARLKSLEIELSIASSQLNTYNKIKDESKLYSKVISQEINNIVNESFEPIREVVTSILKDYMRDDSVYLKINKEPDEIDSETGEILSEFISIKVVGKNSNGISLSPNKYFNTFRYRLFSMMIGISVAIASRNLTKINLPLVLDDVFYASDFEKRNSIISFINNLFLIFDKYSELPFQLILFTHDELIFDSILIALTNNGQDENTTFAKLLPAKEAERQAEYWELSYRLSNTIPDFAIRELLNLN